MRVCGYIYQKNGKKRKRGSKCQIRTNDVSGFCSIHKSTGPFNQFINLDTCVLLNAAIDGREVNCLYELPTMESCTKCNALLWPGESKSFCCELGRLIILPQWPQLPNILEKLYSGNDDASKHFKDNIRQYNNHLAFGSLRLPYDQNLASRHGSGIYCYRINGIKSHIYSIGEIYSSISTVVNPNGTDAAFSELYMIDPLLTRTADANAALKFGMDMNLLLILRQMMLDINPFASQYQSFGNIQASNLSLRLISGHQRIFEIPNSSTEIAGLIPGDGSDICGHHDIVVQKGNNRKLKAVPSYHQCYDPLLYVLLFPHGNSGYSIYLRDINGRKISMIDYYKYYLFSRSWNKYIFLSGRLFHQFLIDVYCRVEKSRLIYLRTHQKEIRGLNEDINDGSVRLPSSFLGGPRYMIESFHDSMAIVRKFGPPSLFITFTSNPEWKEILSSIEPNQTPADRPDIVARVFKLKLSRLISEIKDGIFGPIKGLTYTIEFQKRGLPHAHILIFLLNGQLPVEIVDNYVCAELPAPGSLLLSKVRKFMVHKPCNIPGNHKCFDNGVCKHSFPKSLNEVTYRNEEGFYFYRRRGRTATQLSNPTQEINDSWIVPYSPYLLQRFDAHINVEVCAGESSVKYLFKYLHKGADMGIAEISQRDEIKEYVAGRYISASEAIWRLFEFGIYKRQPNVKKTKLTAFFDLNNEYETDIYYQEIPTKFIWNQKLRKWLPRQIGKAIGRVYFVSPSSGELFYLRQLLFHVRSPTSFENLRTFNGILFQTFKEALEARGLLTEENEAETCMKEASLFKMPSSLRKLFVLLLLNVCPDSVHELWNKFKISMSEDYIQLGHPHPEFAAIQDILKNLDESSNLAYIFHNMISSTSIIDSTIPQQVMDISSNLNPEQQTIYSEILEEVYKIGPKRQFFIEGSGGVGKTYLYRALMNHMMLNGKSVIATASTGIAATMLENGTTAHSRFKLSILPREDSFCSGLTSSELENIKNANLIIWDECLSISKLSLEEIERSLRIWCNSNSPFGGN